MRQRLFAWTAVLALTGCLGTSPEAQARLDAYPGCPDEVGSPEHCPGTQCLACHGAWNPEGEQFVLAGTVYARPEDPVGLAGAVVTFKDADGATYAGATNAAGNFMVEVTDDPAAVGAYDSGRLLVRRAPRFPIASVAVQQHADPVMPDTMLTMASPIHRDGSCATCHIFTVTTSSALSPGRVYAIQPTGP